MRHMRSIRMSTLARCARLVALLLVSPAVLTSAQTRGDLDGILLCLPESSWTCNGLGKCWPPDSRPDTLAAWKIDLDGKTLALCKRNGSSCAKMGSLTAVEKNEWIAAFAGGAPRPKSFAIDPQTAKFVAISISQPAGRLDAATKRLVRSPDISLISIDHVVGSCIASR